MERDYIRIGDAERDEVTGALHEHFAQGRLTREELDERLDATIAAKTAGDLRKVTHDLPSAHDAPMPYPTTSHTAPSWQMTGPPWHPVGRPAGERPMRRRHAGPPIGLFLVALLMIAAIGGGLGWTVFIAIRVFFIAWLIMVVLGAVRGGRRHHGDSSGPNEPWSHR